MVDKLHNYLYGATFVVKTDNNPLTYLLSTAKLDTTGHRWLAALFEFQFSLKYQPGVGNRDNDALSQRPHSIKAGQKSWVNLPLEGVRAMCQGVEYKHRSHRG